MRKKNYKGRCEKKAVPKCNEIFKAYDAVQSAYVDILSSRDDIVEIRCNVPLEDMDYTSDLRKNIVTWQESWLIFIHPFINLDISIVKQRSCKIIIYHEMD